MLYRYLQQLVSAQASRNRDLEQQLQHLRIGSPNGSPGDNANEDDTLMLHEEVGDDFLSMNGSSSANGINGHRRQMSSSSRAKKFTGFELDTVAEMDQDTDHEYDNFGYQRHGRLSADDDQEMDRPSTAGTGMGGSPLSNESASELDHEGDDLELEERGRKGRDGRPMGLSGANGVKTEEGMETS